MKRIMQLFIKEPNLSNKEQIPDIITAIKNKESVEPIEISYMGVRDWYRIESGENIAIAFVMSNRNKLNPGEYIEVERDENKETVGRINILLKDYLESI